MSLVQLQEELKKLTPQEKLVLANYLVMQAGDGAEPSSAQLAELNRRAEEAEQNPESTLPVGEEVRRLRR